MKELDLDELHKAVSQLMDDTGKPKGKKQPKKTEAVIKDAPTSQPVVAKEEPITPAATKTAGESVRVTVNRPLPKLATRARLRGAAMDIVQKNKPVIAPPSAQAGRTAAIIQPARQVAQEPLRPAAPIEAPDISDETLASINMQADTGKAPDILTKTDQEAWPDPLDFHTFEEEKPKEPAEQTEVPKLQAEPVIAQEPALPETPPPTLETAAPPIESETAQTATPFVTTKVEKRPLGAYADKPAEQPPEPKPAAPSEPEEPPKKSEEPSQLAPIPQPKELSPEVLAVESAPEDAVPQQDEPHDMDNLRQMSIPQQYKTAEHGKNDSIHPVFDTHEYHPPIHAPAHTTHGHHFGIMITLLIVLTLVAAAAYLVLMGYLDLSTLPKLF